MHIAELELCAVAAGSRGAEARAVAAERGVAHVSIAGDPPLDELIHASEPDVVLNAVVGFAGLTGDARRPRGRASTWRSPTRRAWWPAASSRSPPGSAAPGGAACRLRAQRALPVPGGRDAETVALARPHRLRRAVPRPDPRRARRASPRRRRCAPDLEHGAEDHDRLRDADEQGARADRGALPLRRPLRANRGRDPSDLRRAFARPLPRRRCARAPGVSGHARADLLRAHVPGASGDAAAGARSRVRAHARVSRARTRRPFPAWRSRAPPERRGGPRRVCSTPRTRSRSRPSSPASFRFSAIPEVVERTLDASEAPAARDLADLVALDAEARAMARDLTAQLVS